MKKDIIVLPEKLMVYIAGELDVEYSDRIETVSFVYIKNQPCLDRS